MPKGMENAYGKGGKKTRVVDAHQGETPVSGSPQKREAHVEGTRVEPTSEMSRKNDPPKKAQDRMGLKMGARVTSRETKGRN